MASMVMPAAQVGVLTLGSIKTGGVALGAAKAGGAAVAAAKAGGAAIGAAKAGGAAVAAAKAGGAATVAAAKTGGLLAAAASPVGICVIAGGVLAIGSVFLLKALTRPRPIEVGTSRTPHREPRLWAQTCESSSTEESSYKTELRHRMERLLVKSEEEARRKKDDRSSCCFHQPVYIGASKNPSRRSDQHARTIEGDRFLGHMNYKQVDNMREAENMLIDICAERGLTLSNNMRSGIAAGKGYVYVIIMKPCVWNLRQKNARKIPCNCFSNTNKSCCGCRPTCDCFFVG